MKKLKRCPEPTCQYKKQYAHYQMYDKDYYGPSEGGWISCRCCGGTGSPDRKLLPDSLKDRKIKENNFNEKIHLDSEKR